MVKKFLLVLGFLILGLVGYGGYLLFIVPQMVKLPVPAKLPFFSVYYLYYVKPTSPTAFSFGTQPIAVADLGSAIKKDMQDIKKAGFGGIKLGFNFKTNNYIADRIALKAAQEGLYPIGMLSGHNFKPKDRAFTDSEMADWLSFVKDEVKTNKNYIYFWEIWNEPGIDMFRYGSPEEYVTLLKRTAQIIKQENPNAKIIVTLNAEFGGRRDDFSDSVLNLGGGDYFDILSFHPYSGGPYIREEVVKAALPQEKQFVAKYGNRWQLFISEIGQPTSEVSEQEQARLGKIVYQEAMKLDIPLVWFFYSDQRMPEGASIGSATNWGLIRSDGTSRPLYETIKKIMKSHL